MPSDASTELEKFCKDHGVHEVLYQALALKGLESVDDFAYAFPEIRSLEALLSGLSDSDLSDMGSTDQFHGVQAARIRKALRFAHDLCQQPTEPTQQISQPPSLPAAILPQASPASWVENLPPKLSQEAAQELIDDFKTNYPGEKIRWNVSPSTPHKGRERPSTPSCASDSNGTYAQREVNLTYMRQQEKFDPPQVLLLDTSGITNSCNPRSSPRAYMIQPFTCQPFRLELMRALAQRIDDPDSDLPGLEVCQGNWRPAEVPGGLKAAKKRWPKGLLLFAFNGTTGRITFREGCAFLSPVKDRFNFAYETVELCHTWIRISDPSCPVIKMTRAAQTSLAWLAPRIAAIPTTPLSLPPILSSLARADAMAEGDQVGIGGWVSTKHGLAWFAEAYTMEEIRTFWPFLTKDAQKYIACFETLAQLALAMTAKAHHGHTRLSLCLPTESDNTPTEGGVNKLFTTAWPLSEFLSLIASWSSANGVTIQVSHVAGAHNEWADDLSRGRLQAFAHRSRDRFQVSLEMLASASAKASWSSKDPAEVSPIPETPRLDRTPPAVGESYMSAYFSLDPGQPTTALPWRYKVYLATSTTLECCEMAQQMVAPADPRVNFMDHRSTYKGERKPEGQGKKRQQREESRGAYKGDGAFVGIKAQEPSDWKEVRKRKDPITHCIDVGASATGPWTPNGARKELQEVESPQDFALMDPSEEAITEETQLDEVLINLLRTAKIDKSYVEAAKFHRCTECEASGRSVRQQWASGRLTPEDRARKGNTGHHQPGLQTSLHTQLKKADVLYLRVQQFQSSYLVSVGKGFLGWTHIYTKVPWVEWSFHLMLLVCSVLQLGARGRLLGS
ncbi:hypothetical protein AK812_SmicGene36826 [Symbiodinium microadriaticum]|uniref:Uncharacterized protein n=1 Tax=Symbiodinium microadriaticum TaxID=2951 RepID=A0A1Q9CHW3_SYMMI|nr:hypothetical protein AK812_SmicGene36826 [Symbiodinium microadriaticum]